MSAHPAVMADTPVAILPAAGRRIAARTSRWRRGVAHAASVTFAAVQPYALVIIALAMLVTGGFIKWGAWGWFVAAGALAALDWHIDATRKERAREDAARR